MSCITFLRANSVVHRLDPRVRILVAIVFSVTIALSHAYVSLCFGLLAAALLVLGSRLPVSPVIHRLLKLNIFMLFLWLVLPLTTPGGVYAHLGEFRLRIDGIILAGAITLKGNAIVLACTALLSTCELSTLGHALSHLRVPDKLAHLLLFTVRYIDVLHHEYERLVTAMKARGFRPAMNIHTYRSLGYLVAMLLARSLDRSERVIAAMKCRGFRGKFYVLNHFTLHRRDWVFSYVSLAVLATCMALEIL